MKKKQLPDIDKFSKFLSMKIFKKPIISIYQFKRGASSFNYLVKLKDRKFLVKLAWKHKKEGVERLVSIIKTLTTQQTIPLAGIIPIQNDYLFKYKDSYGFVLEYIDAKSIPANKFSSYHLATVLQTYHLFQQTKWMDKNLLIPAYNFADLQKKYSENCLLMVKSFKRHLLLKYLLKIMQKKLLEIGKTPLKIVPEKKCVIHGDFHHNNILFQDKKLAAILDFEDIGYGYASEDLIRFILCLNARLPIFYNAKKRLINTLDIIMGEFKYSYDEWMLGLNSFTLQKMKKVFSRPQKPSIDLIKKLFHLIIFMKKYEFLETEIKKRCL